ncbi:MAG: SUMO ligase siz1 [Vezdaea acicularis]|nr:MAG: SUMO ligase siz1 [Vezdaea acicularis]
MASINGQHLDPKPIAAQIKGLLNRNLTAILKAEGLPAHGLKAAMQARLIRKVEEYAHSRDMAGFKRIRGRVFSPTSNMSSPSPKNRPHSPAQSARPSHSINNNAGRPIGSIPHSPLILGRLTFKDSPFLTVEDELCTPVKCPMMPQNRSNTTASFTFTAERLARIVAEPSLRVMVFCAAENGLGPYSKHDVSFPAQVELKVNEVEVKTNLRGLKNKPGSTRPADITEYVRKTTTASNRIVLVYALTTKDFSFVVNLVKTHAVDELVERLKNGKVITKDTVVQGMLSKAQDADIVATSTIMSLKCPLSTVRMELACRSTLCSHNQCFDGKSFLQLQEQAPTWTCPVCNKVISFEALALDLYVGEILNATPSTVEQVTIEPNGTWSQNTRPQKLRILGGPRVAAIDSDDDLMEIPDTRITSLQKNSSTSATPSLIKTPPISSRETSFPATSAASSTRPLSNKRPIATVIDLTQSDEEDELPRPAKRKMSSMDSLLRAGTGEVLRAENIRNLNFPGSQPYDYGRYPNT